ncbi:MAG: hypothetical protein DDT18_00651 [Actinobacteria bacterium]|nr:hypothetical protein [Actinomycetota bacterium]
MYSQIVGEKVEWEYKGGQILKGGVNVSKQ